MGTLGQLTLYNTSVDRYYRRILQILTQTATFGGNPLFGTHHRFKNFFFLQLPVMTKDSTNRNVCKSPETSQQSCKFLADGEIMITIFKTLVVFMNFNEY